jgi:hypothetical protein
LPMKATVPSCNTSKFILELPTLLLKNIFGFVPAAGYSV